MHALLPLKKQIQKIKRFAFFKKKSSLLLLAVFFVILNCILFLVFLYLIFAINSQKLAKIPGISENISFSYFKKRPDLLSTSKALVIYDATHKNVLLSKNENLRFSPASTAKIMAALVALEKYQDSDVLLYSTSLIKSDSSKMGLLVGESISFQNLLYGMMLPSGNDAAQLIALNYPGGDDAFVKRMNEKAKELGLLNTHFVDPAGYEDENYSTAYDLALLGAYALKNSELARVVGTKQKTVLDVSGTIPHVLKNLNELLSINGVNGIKTGFTNEAEGVLVSSFFHNNTQYIMVVLRSKDRFSDTRDLITGIIEDLKSESFSL